MPGLCGSTADRATEGPVLEERHLIELRKSGLTDETIRQTGCRSVGNERIQTILGWRRPHDWDGGLAFPYFSTCGIDPEYTRVKPNKPRVHDGKTVKYESPVGEPNRPYLPPPTRLGLEAGEDLVITEGEKKTWAAIQAGFPCIGLVGVWGWQKKRQRLDNGEPCGKRELIPELKDIKWRGRSVYIVFDSDAADKPGVERAEGELAAVLAALGAEVFIVRLPSDDGAKVGLDDFLVANGKAAFVKLIQKADPAEAPRKLTYMDWAKIYLDDRWNHPCGYTLRWWRNEFYRWDGCRYLLLPTAELCAQVLHWLDNHHGPNRPHVAKQVVSCLEALCRIPFELDSSMYLDPTGAREVNWISMKNGVFDLETFVQGKEGFLRPHTPLFFTTTSLPYPYDPEANCPVWYQTLATLMDEDVDRINLLAEFFGYALTTDTSQHAILLLEGPPRSGKGTIIRALQEVVGRENCISPRLAHLGEIFGLQSLLGKKVATCPDAHLGHGDKALGILEILKLISGEDSVEVHRKHLPSITGARLRVRFIIAVNEMPKFGDNSTALSSRVSILPLRNSFVGREDRQLEEKLAQETAGIFNWALEGLRRLRQNGRFTRPNISREVEAEFATLNSPIKSFVEDRLAVKSTLEIERQRAYRMWKDWCEENGHMPGSNEAFAAKLRACIPSLGSRRGAAGTRPRYYVGIGVPGEEWQDA